MDEVFKALADPKRRTLLDALRDRDGRTLGELEATLPDLTRFGVMKHLRVLEDAGLITTRREGRTKRHFLNAVPIRLIHDRWIRRYDVPIVGAMSDIKALLEAPTVTKTTSVNQVYIRTTPERLWEALTNPELTRRYYYHSLMKSEWTPGSRWTSESPDGELYLEGEILEAEPPSRLVQTFHVVHEAPASDEPPSRVTWSIERQGELCRLTVTHEEMGEATREYTSGGWSYIISGLKTLLETGEELAPAH